MEKLKALVGDYVKAEGITKNELAERMGIGRSALYAKLGGQTPWLLDEAVKLAELLGITVDELAKLMSRQ